MNGLSTTPGLALAALGGVLLLVAGSMAMAESALLRATKASAQDLIEAGKRNAHLVLALVEARQQTLSAVRGWRVLTQTIATVAITLAVADTRIAWWLVLLVATTVTAVGVLVLGTLAPFQLGRRRPYSTLLILARPTQLLLRAARLGRPFMRAFYRLRPPPAQTQAEARHEVAEEMREMVDQVGETDGFADEDRQMLKSVFELGQTLAREVMLPRIDMVTVSEDETVDEALALLTRSGFSRVPVVGDDIDDVKGVIYLKDIIRRVRADDEVRAAPCRNLMRQTAFIPEMKPVDDVMRLMQAEAIHMVMIVNEYGGIAGLVTMEDILEELIGEVVDEHDHAEPETSEIEPGVWEVPARLGIDDLGELFGLELEDEDVDSAGGLLAKALGKVPLPGASANIYGLELAAGTTQGRRKQILTVTARRASADEETQ